MNNNSNIGPYWAVDSQEMLLGLAVFGFIILLPVLPLTILGWYIGSDIIGNNFAKWTLSIVFSLAGYVAIVVIEEKKDKPSVALFIFLEYYFLDIVTSLQAGRPLLMVEIVKAIISWGLSNS